MNELLVLPLPGIPEVTAAHNLADLVRAALQRAGHTLADGDVLVVSSKVVSKAEGLRAQAVTAEDRQRLVLEHSEAVVAERRTPTGLTRIVVSEAGPVLAGAGLDDSNTGPAGGSLILPSDPDLAARTLYAGLLAAYAPVPLPKIGIVISDTAGRPWRHGQVDFALGSCGLEVVEDLRAGDQVDADGRPLRVTARAIADEIASAADLVKGKVGGVPAALVRGLPREFVGRLTGPAARSLVRTGHGDWFSLGTAEAIRTSLGVPPGTQAARDVGIADVGTEREHTRIARAIALTLYDLPSLPPHDSIRVERSTLLVSVPDPFLRGYVLARLEVALHSEGLSHLLVQLSGQAGEHGAPSEAHAAGD